MEKTTVHIKGMHCRSCELLIEDELMKIACVRKAVVSQKTGTAEISYTNHLNQQAVENAIQAAGYEVGVAEKKPFFSRNINDYFELVIYAGILIVVFLFAKEIGLFNLGASAGSNYSSLPIVFLIGITAGLSTCMALVGGLVLGASARFVEKHPTATPIEKFKPHIFFNIGRISSYFILGGLIGYLGSFFQISTSVLGFLTIAVGLVMLVLGFQLTEIFPRLSSLNFTLPKSISNLLGIQQHKNKEYSHTNSMIMGALTFFLPCGFTQAMQLFAISSGSPVTGALTMGVFAIGTAPGLLGIGGLTALVKGMFAKTFFKFAGLVVIGLSLFNISNGYNLTGLSVFASSNGTTAQSDDPNVTIENGVQVVKMTQNTFGYSPNSFTIKKGIPVRWIVNSTDTNTCAASIVSSTFGIRQGLQLGDNVIEFTPSEVGSVRFSCIMGMYTGTFNVVDDAASDVSEVVSPTAAQVAQAGAQAAPPKACGGSGGCGCGSAKKPTQVKAGELLGYAPDITVAPTPTSVQADEEVSAAGTVQVIRATYTQTDDIQPNHFTVKAGIPVRLEIDSKDDGYGCMGSMALPGLSQKIEVFTAGQKMTFDFTPSKTGSYQMTCAMGVPRGEITVI